MWWHGAPVEYIIRRSDRDSFWVWAQPMRDDFIMYVAWAYTQNDPYVRIVSCRVELEITSLIVQKLIQINNKGSIKAPNVRWCIPTKRASNAKSIPVSWRHHTYRLCAAWPDWGCYNDVWR